MPSLRKFGMSAPRRCTGRGVAARPRVDVPTKAWRPFDVDVGPDGDGGASAVYSRCRDEFLHRGCDLYRFNLRRGEREQPLRKINTSADEQLPTIWGPRIAFARGNSIVNVQLRIANIRTGSSKRVLGGSPPVTSTSGGQGPLKTRAHRGSGPVTLELAGDRLAFTWDTIPAQCPGESTSNIDPDAVTNTSREVWTATLSTPSRRVTAGCENGQESFFDGLTWFGDQLGLSVLKPSDALRYRLSFQLRSVDGTLLRQALLPNVAALPPTAYDGRYVYYRAASISSDRSELRRAPFLAIGR